MAHRTIVGIDVGTTKVCTIVAQVQDNGRANVLGTLLGACVIQLVRYTLLANGVPDAAALVVKAGLIVLAVFIQQRADRG